MRYDDLPESGNVLTHCNTGSLATVHYGTALGMIRAAVEGGKQLHVCGNTELAKLDKVADYLKPICRARFAHG